MSQNEPGLELHEWETRWAELEELFEVDPAGALPDACDFLEQALGEGDAADGAGDERLRAYRAARETADRIERGEDVDPGDVGAAIENARTAFESVRAARRR